MTEKPILAKDSGVENARISSRIIILSWCAYLLGSWILGSIHNPAGSDHPLFESGPVYQSVLFYILAGATLYASLRRWREIWRTGLLVGVSIGVALLLGHWTIGWMFPELNLPPMQGIGEERFHHLNPPNEKLFGGYNDGERVFLTTNEDGFRSSYSMKEFRKLNRRIALLGDSFIFGPKVREEETVARIMEDLLRDRLGTNDLGVLNAGIVSYSPFLEFLVFKGKVANYRPHLTLLFLDPTDISDDARYLKEASRRGDQIVFPHRESPDEFRYWGFVYHSLVEPTFIRPIAFPFALLLENYGHPGASAEYDFYRTEVVIDGQKIESRFFIYDFPLEKTRPYFESTYEWIEETAALCREIGSAFILVICPRYHHWSQRECPENWERDQFDLEAIHQFEYFRFFHEKREGADFQTLDLLPAFQETDEFPLVFQDDPHWNERGHRFVATRVVDFLMEYDGFERFRDFSEGEPGVNPPN